MYWACAAWCQLTECMEKLIKTHAFTRFSYYRLVLLFYEILHSEGVVLFCVRSLISDHVKKKWQLKISGIWKMTSLVVNNPRITCSCASEEFSENIKLNSFRKKSTSIPVYFKTCHILWFLVYDNIRQNYKIFQLSAS